MGEMTVFSDHEQLNELIRRFCLENDGSFTPVFFHSPEEAVEFTKFAFPEIKILYFSHDNQKIANFLSEIAKDPWLNFGGTIAIHDENNDERKIQQLLEQHNLIAVMRRDEVFRDFPRLLCVLDKNRQILFQRGMQRDLMHNISGSFVLGNDPIEGVTIANLVSSFLFSANFIDQPTKSRLQVTLHELLLNAVEHGNCCISYEEKTAWLQNDKSILNLVRKKTQIPEINAKKVYFQYSIGRDCSRFTVADDGDGFDWRAEMNSERDLMELHGMGIKIAKMYFDSLTYSEKGNQAFFLVDHKQCGSSVIPALFESATEITYPDGGVICTEGEQTDSLFYIVSGTLQVFSKGELVTTLSPNDIFIGEMSFLLCSRRSATVKSQGSSTLIQVSKRDFVKLLKENPHYGIFLARLLAQRLDRLNLQLSSLKREKRRVCSAQRRRPTKIRKSRK